MTETINIVVLPNEKEATARFKEEKVEPIIKWNKYLVLIPLIFFTSFGILVVFGIYNDWPRENILTPALFAAGGLIVFLITGTISHLFLPNKIQKEKIVVAAQEDEEIQGILRFKAAEMYIEKKRRLQEELKNLTEDACKKQLSDEFVEGIVSKA